MHFCENCKKIASCTSLFTTYLYHMIYQHNYNMSLSYHLSRLNLANKAGRGRGSGIIISLVPKVL